MLQKQGGNMKKKKLEKKLRRLEKRLWIAEINKIPGLKYFATKEAIAEIMRENRRRESAIGRRQ